MKLGNKARSRVRPAVLAVACVVTGVVAGPGLADAAQRVAQDVFVTNTAANPVPVAPQGTTQVAGTVNVANQPEPPAPEPKPRPIQKRFEGTISDENHGAFATVAYNVPAGKILTVEYGQLYVIKPYEVNGVSFSVSCSANAGTDIESVVWQLPELASSETWHLFGGPMTLVVPGGSCLQARLHVLESNIPSGTGLGVNGGFTGFLTDAP
ncbi:MAG: hypothetical protein QOJ13_3450 [Gaiellales bacterium]|nr:hypothetical protein [Gaiellales bacterium]